MDVNIPTDVLRSFVAIASTGSFTHAADQVLRTQSAVSQQMGKLEATLDKRLFERAGRRVKLTGDGEALLGYARRILMIHDEAVASFSEPDITGVVRFGIPDDYVMNYLPPILSTFAQSFPRVQLEIDCRPTTELIKLTDKDTFDLALITCGFGEGKSSVLRHEPTVWATSPIHAIHEIDPLPLAVFETGCRVRQAVLEAFDKTGREYRIAYASPSITGLACAVQSGLAVTALARSTVPEYLRIIGEEEGFPKLPGFDIGLIQSNKNLSPAAASFGEHVERCFHDGSIPA